MKQPRWQLARTMRLCHAIVAESVKYANPVHKISIIPRGIGALGYTQQRPTEERYLMTRPELLDRLAVLLGGRVAKELVFGEISTGAQNDLQRATDIARSMVTEYGMSDLLGPVTIRNTTSETGRYSTGTYRQDNCLKRSGSGCKESL